MLSITKTQPSQMKTAMGLNRSEVSSSTARRSFGQHLSAEKLEMFRRAISMCTSLIQKHGIYSTIEMEAAGFRYTSEGDTACCDACDLRVSQWTHEMKPFAIHAHRSPNCLFVRSMQPTSNTIAPPSRPNTGNSSDNTSNLNGLVEVNMLKQVRKRTFSHYPHRPSAAQMIEAGFFSCNVGDRVICLYCNLICHQWTLQNDDPWETHSTLSPKCPYVLARSRSLGVSIINDQGQSSTRKNESLRRDDVGQNQAYHPTFIDVPRRKASFATWSAENVPPVDTFVRAGFFYTGTKTIVTCFYCNGSLPNWGAGDNPMVEHARWFPQCAYVKELCGPQLYQKIQAVGEPIPRNSANHAFDETTLSLLVAQRLDLPVSHRLLCQGFQLSTSTHCWTEQLRLKHDDFVDDCDLLLACTILQKQIDHIAGNKANMVVPSVRMKQLRDGEGLAAIEDNAISMNNSSESDDPSPSVPCDSCQTEEKQMALIPCYHVQTNVLLDT